MRRCDRLVFAFVIKKETYEVNISTVRSVSGFSIDVLKFGPFSTENHCPFLDDQGSVNTTGRKTTVLPLDDELTLS